MLPLPCWAEEVLPHLQRQEVQESAQLILTSALGSLTGFYLTDCYGPSRRTAQQAVQGQDQSHGLRLEAWAEFRYRDGAPACDPAPWHVPSASEVCASCPESGVRVHHRLHDVTIPYIAGGRRQQGSSLRIQAEQDESHRH